MSESAEFGSESRRKSIGANDDTVPSRSRDPQSLRDFQSRTLRLIHDNPIVAGFAALAVGALIGALIPETDREHELMGSTRDRLAGRARELARDGMGRARDMASTAGHAATDAVKRTDVGRSVGFGESEPTL